MARIKRDVIIIPWDYTESSRIALLHAIQLAKEVNNQIMLARFLDSPGLFASKSVKDKLTGEEQEKLKEVGREIEQEFGINPYIAVELGIGKKTLLGLVEDAKANLIIMGPTYKLNDKVTLSQKDAVKRMQSLDIPFIVAKNKPAHNYYKEIVVPLDHDKRYKETLHWVIYLSKYYNCNINIIKPYLDDELKKKDMANNIYFTKRTLDKKNIIYGIKTAKKKKIFEEEVFRFSEMIDADLTVMMVKTYFNFIAEHPDHEQDVPVMVINRNSKIIRYGGFR